MWKGTNKEYKAALTKFTVSGTHENEFWNFCNGKIEVYYLRRLLQNRPNLVDFVEADLPTEAAISSAMGTTEIAARLGSDVGSVLTEHTAKKRKTASAQQAVAVALNKIAESESGKTDLVRSRIQLLQNEDGRRLEEKKMKEWNMISTKVRQLRQDLRDPDLGEDDKKDMKADLDRLVKRKNKLADELGWEP
mmetsp:Transcript_8653/g.17731  ORF Transcript_8653/g.17731 Transcript_8653/m.17731 type:complete len:192 (-) Transcript_8653:44-619(-)